MPYLNGGVYLEGGWKQLKKLNIDRGKLVCFSSEKKTDAERDKLQRLKPRMLISPGLLGERTDRNYP